MKQEVIDAVKAFDWLGIIGKATRLEDLNDRQWRFIKGLVAELIVEKHSGPNGLVYVGADHKDYYWPHFGLSVELKSGLSGSMYTKKGQLKKNFGIKFTNSNGTNKKTKLDASKAADILLVVKNDGAFIVDQATVIRCSKKGGDGFTVVLTRDDIIEVTGRIAVNNSGNLNLKEKITNAIREVI